MKKATIIGTKTYGKRCNTNIDKLIRWKWAKKQLPKNTVHQIENKINKVGIEPNITVELPEGITELTKENDTQLQRAIEELSK